MVADQLLRKIHSRRVIGCSVMLGGETMEANACLLVRKGKKVSLLESYPDLDLNKLKEIFNAKVPVVLSLTGESVITKPVKITDGKWHQMVDVLFPHLREEEFVMQFYQVNEERGLVSLIRHSEVEHVLTRFANAGVQVFDFFLGPFALDCLLGTDDNEMLDAGNYNIHVVDGRIADLRRHESSVDKKIQIGSVSMSHRLSVAYASGLSFFLDERPAIEKVPSDYKRLREQYYAHLILQLILHRVAPVLFVIALIATIANWYYAGKSQQLSEIQLEYQVRQQIDKRGETDFEHLRTLVNELRWNRAAFASFYGDRLAKSVPNGITIDRLEIFTQKFRNNSKHQSFFDPSNIQISGTTDKAEILALWMEELTNVSWVKSINEKKYQWDQNRATGIFSFQIVLNDRY